jgi:toxin ParE1/3/4
VRIRWTPAAAADLANISDYLNVHHPQYEISTVERLYQGIRSLRHKPFRGRPGRAPDTRELLFPPLPYLAVYRVRQDVVEVLRIYHAAQNRP